MSKYLPVGLHSKADTGRLWTWGISLFLTRAPRPINHSMVQRSERERDRDRGRSCHNSIWFAASGLAHFLQCSAMSLLRPLLCLLDLHPTVILSLPFLIFYSFPAWDNNNRQHCMPSTILCRELWITNTQGPLGTPAT